MENSLVSSQLDTSRQNLTIEEAAELFNQAGVPRSTRTISRYCEQGVLEAVFMDTEKNQKYLITRASVERRIKEIKQVLEANRQDAGPATSGRNETYPDMTRQNKTGPDTTRRDETEDVDEAPTLAAQVKKLKAENFQLQIDRAAKEQVIDRLMDEREKITLHTIELSRELGRLENQLLQLEAPARPEMSGHDTTDPRGPATTSVVEGEAYDGLSDEPRKPPEHFEPSQKSDLAA